MPRTTLQRLTRLVRHQRTTGLFSKALLQRHWRGLGALPATALVLGAVSWGLLLRDLSAHRQAIEAKALQDAGASARAYAQQLHRSFELVDKLALFVRDGWQNGNGRFSLESLRKSSYDKTVPPGFTVSIIDERGYLVTSTIARANEVNVASAPYFVAHRGDSDKLYIGTATIGMFSNMPVVPLSRRLTDAAGNFKGIVLVSVIPSYFMSNYDDIVLGKKGFLAFLSPAREVRLARVGDDIFLPAEHSLLMPPNPSIATPSGAQLIDQPGAFADARARYIGWQVTPEYGVLAVTGLDQQNVLAQLEAIRQPELRLAAYASAALGILTLLSMVFYLRVAQRKQQFRMMQANYRAATEGAVEGFMIATAEFDEHDRIQDFCIADCNERGAMFLGYRREELIGRKTSMLYQGRVARLVKRLLHHAYQTRELDREVELTRLNLKGPSWMHLRIVRPDNSLAITMRDVSDAKAHLAELERRGSQDALTGLQNRRWALGYLPDAIAKAKMNNSRMALLFVDLDQFKEINDTAGHDAGDDALRVVGQRLQAALRPRDHVVRMGGDEFLVVLESIEDEADAAFVANRILEALRSPVRTSKGMHTLGASIGVSVFPQDGTDTTTLLSNADVAMYSVKTKGKCGFAFYDPQFSQAIRARHVMRHELVRALEADHLVVYYQPRVDINTGAICSLEALVRWVHPTNGIIGPVEFIPLAEESGLIVRLGEQVIQKVCAQMASWAELGKPLVPVSINVSAHQFRDTCMATVIAEHMTRYNIAPHLIEIELTESCMVDDNQRVATSLSKLRDMGVKLLVDDFGTGYSSLSQLQRLHFDVLKVDRAFTIELEESHEGKVLFSAIITMAHALGMRVVAEGVETLAQCTILKSLACDEIQGFYISRPGPPTIDQPRLPAEFTMA